EPERVFEVVEPVARRFVPAVDQPAIGLQEHGRSEKPISIPPMTGTSRGTAKTEDALVKAVEFAPILRRLKPLLLGLGRRRLKPWFNEAILCKKLREIGHQILDYSEMVERVNRRGLCGVGYEPRAG